jgi:hypothetical protein
MAKMSCLRPSGPVEVLALALAEPEGELELELELEHPAAPNRPAATTVAPSQVVVRRLRICIKNRYAMRVTHAAAE